MTEMKEKMHDKVIKLHFEEHLNAYQIAEVTGVSKSAVFNWIRTFAIENQLMTDTMQKRADRKDRGEQSVYDEVQMLKDEVSRLKAENKALNLALADERKALAEERDWSAYQKKAYDLFIDTAEKKFNISIRKKPGAK